MARSKEQMDSLIQRPIHSAILAFLCLMMTFGFAADLHAAGSYTITATAGSGGSISPSGAVSVKTGANQAFTITPNTGYHVANVTVDGNSQGAITSYTFTNVRANHTISATFAINTYTITASAGSGGSISPSGAVSVNYGANQTFTITPNIGYHVADLTVDGNSQGAITSYTFSNITAAHTIAATFAINTYTITATAGSGGTVTPSTATVNYGGSQTFTIAPNTNYHIANVTVDSVSQGAITSYTFSNVAANHTIAATFAINTFTINASAGNGGTISPSGAVVVNYGGSQTFTITPNSGYNFVNVTVDGVSKGAVTSYTFTNITANHTISATFATSAPSQQSTANYFYDDLGRLSRVVQGTSGVIYSYDEVGNLVSASNATTSCNAPVLSAVNPNAISVGYTMLVTLTGQNLLTTQTVSSVNGLFSVRILSANDTQITTEMTVLTAGNDIVRVSTPNGTATIGIILTASAFALNPSQLAIVQGGSGTLTVSVSPPPTSPLTINLLSTKPSVASVPQTVTIPTSGTASFTVNGLTLGSTNISAGGPFAVVFVNNPFVPDQNGESVPVGSQSISVLINPPVGTFPNISIPVSVAISPSVGTFPNISTPVSVAVSPQAGTFPSTSAPVSVAISPPVGTSPTLSHPVSVKDQ